jgi:hypothetical protein
MHFLFPTISLVISLWVYFDSQKKGYTVKRGLLWAIGVFLGWIIFLPLYLISSKKKVQPTSEAAEAEPESSSASCFYCGQKYEGKPDLCPRCGQNLKLG